MTLLKNPRLLVQQVQRRLPVVLTGSDSPSESAIRAIADRHSTPRW